VIDSCSNDGTQEILREYEDHIDHLIIEKDKGIYDAMNKGINASTGDLIGIINSDDFYKDNNVISKVVEFAENNQKIDAILSNVSFINKDKAVIRKISSKNFKHWMLRFGWMPPHPGIFLTRKIVDKIGLYDTSYSIAADFEYCVRLFSLYKVNYSYLGINSVLMREGGISTKGIRSNLIITREMLKALGSHNIYSNTIILLLRLPIKLLMKFLSRIKK
tara:strand:+ start:44208 stop:44864 length:657 start_codon:yes stop_codon:yes gene_type:complete